LKYKSDLIIDFLIFSAYDFKGLMVRFICVDPAFSALICVQFKDLLVFQLKTENSKLKTEESYSHSIVAGGLLLMS
jgi:hypothetical protein